MKKTFKKILQFFLSKKKIKKGTVLILETAYPSGSNTRKVYNKLKSKYNVSIIYNEEIGIKEKTIREYIKHIKILYKISGYNYLICTHGFWKNNKKQILIDLWHGIPIKAMMYMEPDNRIYREDGFNADYLITSSKLESVLMGACTHISYDKHRILGSPRNDYLLNKNSNLGTFDFMRNYDSVIIYVPTFRQGYLNRMEGQPSNNLFYFENFNKENFKKYLKENDILLVIKYHPFEEKLKKNESSLDDNIYHLTNKELINNDLDLYEILPHTDLLITDYSSIYFDYLLMDKPVIFTPVDLEEYSKDRGFLLEPYKYWTPGPKCKTQEVLQNEVLKSLCDNKYYKKEREQVKEIFHNYQDGKSTERVIELIEDIMKGVK